VLCYEDAPDPGPGPDDVRVELRAVSLNRLDIWVRKALPSLERAAPATALVIPIYG
jgi:NADPH:quinone reductase-like Zn-dependent oxidoreductase